MRISHLSFVFRITPLVSDVKSDMTGPPNSSRCPKMVQSPSCCIRVSSCSVHPRARRVPDDLVGCVKVSRAWVVSGRSVTQPLGLSTPGLMVTSPRVGERRFTSDHAHPGMKIGQVSFMQMTTPAENPYGKVPVVRSIRSTRPDAEPLLRKLQQQLTVNASYAVVTAHSRLVT